MYKRLSIFTLSMLFDLVYDSFYLSETTTFKEEMVVYFPFYIATGPKSTAFEVFHLAYQIANAVSRQV